MLQVYNLTVYFFLFCQMVLGNVNVITQVSKVCLMLAFIGVLIPDKRKGKLREIKKNGMYLLWFFVFVVFCYASLYWTIDKEATVSDCRTMTICLLCNIALFYYFTRFKWTVNGLFKFCIITSFVSLFVFLLSNGVGVFAERTADRNINDVGIMFAMSIVFGIYLLKNKCYKRNRLRLYFIISVFSMFIVLSGSKKALILPLSVLIIENLINSGGSKKIFVILGGSLGLILMYYLMMNVDFLYNYIGIRFEGMINGFLGNDIDADTSTRSRLDMMEFALEYYSEHKYLGIGLGSIDKLLGTYAHNNYVELLSCLGIVGTLLFYSIYIYLINGYYKLIKKERSSISILFFSVLISYLFLHFGMVAYYDYFNHFIVVLAASYLCIQRNKRYNNEIIQTC